MMVLTAVFIYFFRSVEVSVVAQDYVTVTTSGNLTDGSNFFVDPTIQTDFSLPDCISDSIGGNTIAYIEPQSSSVYFSQMMSVINGINAVIVNAYKLNNQDAPTMNVQSFSSEKDLNSYVQSRNYENNQICFAYGFSNFDLQLLQFEFNLYFQKSSIPSTKVNQTDYQAAQFAVSPPRGFFPAEIGFSPYYTSGFQQLMTTATQQIILQSLQFAGQTQIIPNFAVAYLPMNTGTFTINSAGIYLVFVVGMLAVSIQTATGRIIGDVICEPHEIQLKQLLRQSGMNVQTEVVYRMTIYSILCAVLVPLISLFLQQLVLTNVTFGVIFIFSILFAVEYFLLSVLLLYGFGKYAVLANIIYTVLVVVISIFTALSPSLTPFQIEVTSIIPSMQLQNFAKLAFYAMNNASPQISLSQLGVGIYGVQPAYLLLIGLGDLFVMLLLLTYLWPLYFKVDPEKNLRFYYPFTCSYWRREVDQEHEEDRENVKALNHSLMSRPSSSQLQESEVVQIENGLMEVLKGTESHETLKITNLVKNFGSTVAVNNLTLTLFKDQILVLLGHNGAGKTTTISMLTRELKPTSGSATAFGVNLFSEGDFVDLVQFCPQINILIDKMTVYENLMFFCLFRDIEMPEAKITQILEEFNMVHKKNSFASQLSGGQKRKLQLMIAIIGNSKILLLDEPSSGMDPNSRRETWSILTRLKKDRIVVMTTHYMDEAEVLGDRIAIISHGELQCCGSSLFLKNKYSNGFFIQIRKIDSSDESALTQFEQVLISHLEKTEARNVPLAKTIDESGQTVYSVPRSFGKYIEEMFRYVDTNMKSLNIAQYSIRSASLEEVFIDIGEREKLGKYAQGPTENYRERTFSQSDDVVRAQLGEKSIGRSFKAYFLLHFMTSIPKIVSVVIIAVITISFGSYATVFTAKMPSPSINTGSVTNVYKNDPGQIPVANNVTINGGQLSTSFVCGQVANCSDVIYQEIQGNTSTPIESLTSWGLNLQDNFGVNILEGSFLVYDLPQSPQSNEQLNVAVYGNLKSLSSQNVYGNLVLNRIGTFYTGNPGFNIQFVNKPLPGNAVLQSQKSANATVTLGTMITLVVLILTILTSNQIGKRFDSGFYFMLMTKSGAKKLYFTSIYLVDFITHAIAMAVIILIIYAFGMRIDGILLFGLLFSITNPLFIYSVVIFAGLNRRKPARVATGIFTGILSVFLLIVNLLGPLWYERFTYKLAIEIGKIFSWLPVANFVNSFISVLLYRQISIWNGQLPQDQKPLGQYGAEIFVKAQIALIFVYGILVALLLFGCGRKRASNSGLSSVQVEREDYSVKEERERLKNNDQTQQNLDIVRGLDLVKQYKNLDPNPQQYDHSDRPDFLPQEAQALNNPKNCSLAVKGVSFGVKAGEVFGLLGVSGAGKTSIFNMILGEENLSGGHCQINGLSVEKIYQKPEKLDGIVGYCPQTNPIEDGLTVMQTLTYIAYLVGVKQENIQEVLKQTIARFGLSEFENTRAGDLSGGNKRKLSCCMSMLGNPKVMFVDEASTGVDPISRRLMWKGMRFESINSALILTTHTLEEVEALATKIGIMVSGHLKCYGTLQKIQQYYGNGFEIELNLNLGQLNERLEDLDSEKRMSNDASYVRERLACYYTELMQRNVPVNLNLVNEFTDLGLLSVYYQKVEGGEAIDMVQLSKEIQVQNAVSQIVTEISMKLSQQVHVTSYDGSYLKLRLEQKVDLTYGRIYGILESLKPRLPIREYSCRQSSLEQIFVSFAKNDQLKVFNNRLQGNNLITRAQISPLLEM